MSLQVSLQELQAIRATLSRAPEGARPGTAGSSADLYMSAVAEAVHAHWSNFEPEVEVAKHNLIYDTHTNLGLSFNEVHTILDEKCQRLQAAEEQQERGWTHRVKERGERAQRDRRDVRWLQILESKYFNFHFDFAEGQNTKISAKYQNTIKYGCILIFSVLFSSRVF